MNAAVDFKQHVLDALEGESGRIKEEVIAEAKQNFEKKIREAVGNIAFSLAEMYSMEILGGNLVITVRIDKEKK